MREINSGVFQSYRNRNLFAEYLPGRDLPIKYDLLNGRPIKDYDFMTSSFNAISPVSLNLDRSDGRNFLFNSGYDLRMSTYYAPDGTNLTDDPEIRSEFQRAIGEQNLEFELDKLSRDKDMIASMELMIADIKAGKRGEFDARDYYHNQVIDRLFKNARKVAWAKISVNPNIAALIAEQEEKRLKQLNKQFSSYNLQNMYK